ncbi:hypothetical protein CU072_29260 [Bacillus thuringiensis]|nr:hypothetical protein CU072_29260 [Bacillus thuringiensis]RKI19796.1 hypothetical protein D7V71_28830 [Bacillus thuringiensis]
MILIKCMEINVGADIIWLASYLLLRKDTEAKTEFVNKYTKIAKTKFENKYYSKYEWTIQRDSK